MDCGGITSGIPSQFLQGAAAIHQQQQQVNHQLQNLINVGAPPEEIAAMAHAAEQLEAEAALFHHHHEQQQQHEQHQQQQQQQWAAEFEQQQHHQQQFAARAELEQQQMIMEMQQQAELEQQQQQQQQMHQQSVPWENEFLVQQQQQPHQEGDWAQDFNNTNQVQVFGVQGEDQANMLNYEEKQQLSEFNGLMNDLRTGRAEIVEGDDVDVQEMNAQQHGGLNDNDEVDETTMEAAYNHTAEEQEFLNEFAARQLARNNGEVLAEEDDEEFARQFLEQQRLQNEGDQQQQWNLNDEDDEWTSEFMENANRAELAKRSSEYPFEENNPYLFHENPFEEGINFLQAGVLSEAVLAFEAACQQNNDKAEAWQYLGTTQAENEKDAHAITALNKALSLVPANPTVLLALAACFTNEMMHDKAMLTLKAWLRCDPKFVDLEEHLAAIQPSEEEQARMNEEDDGQYVKDFFFVDSNEHRNICHLFEAASDIDPGNVQIHVALGTLRHLGHEYLKAAAHFEQAVKIQPDNEKLWNKLGATLANGQQSERAIDAYRRALDINPGFVRAEYNMGIANSNLGRHREAARHFVKAIMLQSGWTDPSCDEDEDGGVAMSKSAMRTTRDIWDVLRMSLGCLERQDLVQSSWQHKLTPFVREFGCMPAGVE